MNPSCPWDLDTELKVYTLAHELGAAPERRWLVYSHAPRGEERNVTVTLPGYGNVRLPEVAVGGTFYVVDEQAKSLEVVEP